MPVQQFGVGIDGTGHQVAPPRDEGVADPTPSAVGSRSNDGGIASSSGLTAAPSSSTARTPTTTSSPSARRCRVVSSARRTTPAQLLGGPEDEDRAAGGQLTGEGRRRARRPPRPPRERRSFDLECLEQGLRGAGERGRRVSPRCDRRPPRPLAARLLERPEHGGIDSTVLLGQPGRLQLAGPSLGSGCSFFGADRSLLPRRSAAPPAPPVLLRVPPPPLRRRRAPRLPCARVSWSRGRLRSRPARWRSPWLAAPRQPSTCVARRGAAP